MIDEELRSWRVLSRRLLLLDVFRRRQRVLLLSFGVLELGSVEPLNARLQLLLLLLGFDGFLVRQRVLLFGRRVLEGPNVKVLDGVDDSLLGLLGLHIFFAGQDVLLDGLGVVELGGVEGGQLGLEVGADLGEVLQGGGIGRHVWLG